MNYIPVVGEINNSVLNENFRRLQSRVDSGIIRNDVVRVAASKTPASATADGNTGDIAWDADYIYVCVDTNVWKRIGISTW